MSKLIKGTNHLFYKKPFVLNARFVKFYLTDWIGNCYYLFLMNCIRIKRIDRPQYRVSICGIFKNECIYLKEWIEFHKIVGIDHFYLYDNNSNDDFESVLRPYVEDGTVTLEKWGADHDQMGAYRHCIKNHRMESEWIGFIDIDEFVVPIEEDSVIDVLNRFQNRPAVLVYWKLFGSGGIMSRPTEELVTDSFVVCPTKLCNAGKVFYNTKYDFSFEDKRNALLHHVMRCSYKGNISLPTVNIFGKVSFFYEGISFSRGKCLMQINHYFSKSRDEYIKKKMEKSDVYFEENPHTLDYWLMHENWCDDTDYKIYKYIARLKSKME